MDLPFVAGKDSDYAHTSTHGPLSAFLCNRLTRVESFQLILMSQTAFLDIYSGNKGEFEADSKAYATTVALLDSKAATYGLPSTPEDLDEEQQNILSDLSASTRLVRPCSILNYCLQPGAPLRFQPPTPLSLGRLVFDLDGSAGLAKTCTNFVSLCKGDKGMCKNAPNKPLHYKGTAIHRIAKDFVAQGGDVTRNDGSGGEVRTQSCMYIITSHYYSRNSPYMAANSLMPKKA
jgi:hypothetical protein